MMMNLFSSFDPTTNIMNNLSLNWLSTLIIFIFPSYLYWLIPNKIFMFYFFIINNLYKEFKINMKNYKFKSTLLFCSLFIFILLNNVMGLFSYIFTPTSHLIFNFTMVIPLWISLMIFGWLTNNYKMFIHLVPQGTPLILIPFMIMIEMISNLIRPITLTIRLTANLIAGHLLLTLLGNLGTILSNYFLIMLILIQFILLILEFSVAIIQAYVFSTLLSLYFSEI